MTREERLRLLGESVVAQIHERVAEAPTAPDELIDSIRRVLTHPALHMVKAPEASTRRTAA
ncbi:hypothetical protein NW249_31290 [Streptomyces sp. OUCMDZ-4982]|uniref:hypothetical protein n=1 Tax=Streptomyces sp. OUCMDZ-4982 TaxID=2973090 RepID=UPI00215C8F44|nr:hypothetical protein [Streptomyces sp. OUCMDZ-4982]MCR8946589.1 hypothetical protein [Streptomyces sp. OUCMDZ-4982]